MLDEKKFIPKEGKNWGRVQHIQGRNIYKKRKQKTDNEVVEISF